MYRDLDVDFNTEEIVNQVTVKFLRYVPGADTEEIFYGPYSDTASVSTWGRRTGTYTINRSSEDALVIENYAKAILAANSTGAVRVNGATLGINQASDITAGKALLDLQDRVTVKYAKRGLNQTSRVQGISHKITPGKWDVELTFKSDTTVAIPTEIPEVQNGTTARSPLATRVLGSNFSLTNASYTNVPFDTAVESNGIEYNTSSRWFTAPKDGRYSVAFGVQYNGNATGSRYVRLLVNQNNYRRYGDGQTGTTSLTQVGGVATIYLRKGDTLSVNAYQASGSALAVIGDANRGTFAEMTYLGI
ncbi:MAG: hypothetical protein Q7T56_14765 [Nocardioidaceae bacterium]|nr:hypothetical protein [Nocardioidaceae bacterium]